MTGSLAIDASSSAEASREARIMSVSASGCPFTEHPTGRAAGRAEIGSAGPDAGGARVIRDVHVLRPAVVPQVALLRVDEASRLQELGPVQPHAPPDALRRPDHRVLGAR